VSDPVLTDIASAIHVRHVLTPISDVRVLKRHDLVEPVRRYLGGNMFDFAPVFPSDAKQLGGGAEASPGPDGLLQLSDLQQAEPTDPIERFVRPLGSEVLIEARASLNELIARFRAGQAFMVVVGSSGLEGVVTPSDLNKQAGRTQLFMQFCALELALAEIVRGSDRSEDQLLLLLPKERARSAAGRFKKQRERDEAVDLVTAFDLQDLLFLCRAWAPAETALSKLTDVQILGISRFRNTIMHAVLEPAGDDEVRVKQLLDQTKAVAELLACIQLLSPALPAGETTN